VVGTGVEAKNMNGHWRPFVEEKLHRKTFHQIRLAPQKLDGALPLWNNPGEWSRSKEGLASAGDFACG
jgi:hypothetical protein